MRNPYTVGAVVRKPEDFYGRQELLDELLDERRNWICLIGNRRIGKTSLLKAVEDTLDERRQGVAVFISLQGTDGTLAGIGSELMSEVHIKARDFPALEAVEPPAGADACAVIKALADFARRQKTSLTLLFDEAEVLLALNQEQSSRLRAALQDSRSLRVILAGTRQLGELYLRPGAWNTSPLLASFETRYIGALSDEAIEALVCQSLHPRGPVRTPPGLLEKIKVLTGGHPFLIQWLCSRLFCSDGSLRTSEERDEVVETHILATFQVDYGLLSASERVILGCLASQPQSARALEREAPVANLESYLMSLERLGMLAYRGGVYALAGELLRTWLRKGGPEEHPAVVSDQASLRVLNHAPRTIQARPFLKLLLLPYGANRVMIRGLEVPGGGNPKTVVDLPYTPLQLAAVLQALAAESSSPDSLSPEHCDALQTLGLLQNGAFIPDLYRRVGQALYAVLFSGDLLTELGRAQDSRRAVTCQLQFDAEDVLLAQYPWELVHDGSLPLTAIEGGLELTRYVTFAHPPAPLATSLPLQLLYLRPRPLDAASLPQEAERVALLSGLEPLRQEGLLDWEELTPPTWAALEERLSGESCTILHFDGHGDFAALCPNRRCRRPVDPAGGKCPHCGAGLLNAQAAGHLVFEDRSRHADYIASEELNVLLAHKDVRLVVLSACSSGVMGVNAFNGIAPGLIQAGVPAVVGLQGPIQAETMVAFMRRFYRALAAYHTIPEAANQGRRAIYRLERPAWFLPAIYLRSPDSTHGQLFTEEI